VLEQRIAALVKRSHQLVGSGLNLRFYDSSTLNSLESRA
jgi:hypothetical protein